MAGHPDNAAQAQNASRLLIARILLADMDAVAAGGEREIGPIIHEEGDVALLGNRPQRIGRTTNRIVIGALETKLDARDVSRIKRLRKSVREGRGLEGRRCDEIKAGLRHAAPTCTSLCKSRSAPRAA